MYGLPAGYESDSDNLYDDEAEGFGYVEDVPRLPSPPLSPMELKKKTLLNHVKDNQLESLREELDKEPRGFDIDEKVDGHWNLLYHACNLALPEIVQFLVEERGACVNMRENNETPLMVACYSSAKSGEVFKVVKALIKENTIISAPNNHGITPLMYAARAGNIEVVRYLLSLNDAYDALDNDGYNALFHAIESNKMKVAQVLIDVGTDLNVVNRFGLTAKEFARSEYHFDFFQLFAPEPYRYQVPANFLSYNRFEDLIPEVLKTDVPAYFPDVVNLLNVMDCDMFLEKFAVAKVSLEEFLTITDERLIEIGIEYPFQRARIMHGILNFQKNKWTTKSLFVPLDFENEISSYDFVMMMANLMRQLVLVKSHIVFMKQLGEQYDLTRAFDYFSVAYIDEFHDKLVALQTEVKAIASANPPTHPLLIKKMKSAVAKTKKTRIFKIGILITAVPLIVISVFKLAKL